MLCENAASSSSNGKRSNKIPRHRATSESTERCQLVENGESKKKLERNPWKVLENPVGTVSSQKQQTWPPVLGVLQCATCSFRVNGLKPLHCCSDCATSGGESHSELCLQLPLQPVLRKFSNRTKGTTSQQIAQPQTSGVQSDFEQRLHGLLSKGSVQLGCLPAAWDGSYGQGSWANDRPVKQASKACRPPYAHGVEILDGWVHAVEFLNCDELDFSARIERDLERLSSLPQDTIACLRIEFTEIARGNHVSVKLSVVNEYCRCQVGLTGMESCEDVIVDGFGETWDNAHVLARLAALQTFGRWSESMEESFKKLVEVRNDLESLNEWMVQGAFATAELATEEFRERVLSLVEGLANVLQAPPSCEAVCCDALKKIWPHIVSLQDTSTLWRMITVLKEGRLKLPLREWACLGEIACCSMHFNALESLRDLEVVEQSLSAASVYVKYNLYSLFLEQRAQLQQELEKVASEASSRRLWVEMTWKIKSGCWHCCFESAAIATNKGLLLLSPEGDIGNSVMCNIVDDGQAVLLGSMGIHSLFANITTKATSVLFLAGYLVVHMRQREAVLNLMQNESSNPFDPALSCLLLGSWKRDPSYEQDAQALRQARFLAAGRPGPFPPEDIVECAGEACDNNTKSVDCYAPRDFSTAQMSALRNALSRRFSLIRGPPGTGKTHVAAGIVAAILLQWKSEGGHKGSKRSRVLATTHSNVAAANLHRRLESFNVRAARIGTTLSPAEVLEQLLVQEMTRPYELEELAVLRQAAAASTPPVGEDAHRLSVAQFCVLQSLAERADAVVCTCASSGHRGLLSKGMGDFPLLVVDEAAQFVEPGPWVPLGLGSAALVAVGDERQLPATMLDSEASERKLGVSMFERCVLDEIVTLEDGFVQLDVQHRMHPSIAEFPAKTFYEDGGGLQDAPEVHTTDPIPGFPWPSTHSRVCFVNCGTKRGEGEDGSRSRANRHEAELLIITLGHVLRSGTDASDIAVITGYSAQKALLKQMVAQEHLPAEGLKIDTIDGFQGAERELVLASTVRSNCSGEVGFMRDRRRINVLLTRARRGLIIFGDMATLNGESATWQPWLDWAEDHSVVMLADDLERLFRNVANPCIAQGNCAGATSASLAAEDDGWTVYREPTTGRRWRWHEATGSCEWIDSAF